MGALLTIAEAAEHCRVSPSTMKRLYIRKGCPVVRIGASVRFRLADLEAWLDALRVGSFETHGPVPARSRSGGAALSPRAREILERRARHLRAVL